MTYIIYALAALAGLVLAGLLVIFIAAVFLTLRDEFRRRREMDLSPRTAELRRDFFRADIDLLRDVKLWFLWYEDRFDPENSMSFGISVHFSEESARVEFDRRGRPLAPGWDGYTIEGPADALTTTLFGEHRIEMLREVLKRVKNGSREGIPMKN